MAAHTKAWERPELTVLVRGNPEEAVLTNCKISGGTTVGATSGKTSCLHPPGNSCSNPCSALGST